MPNQAKNVTPGKKAMIGQWLGPALVAMVFVALACFTWRKWPDILIDFGRELYVPWQLLEGKVLYRDLAYLNGPLSPYVNAFFFWLFGASLQTLIFCNLALLGLLTAIIYYLTMKTSDNVTATFTCIAFLALFGFGHSVEIGNYNYICPYSHEMTHGLLLFFISLVLFEKLSNKFSFMPLSLLGIVLGLIFLGKGEIFIAAGVAILCGIFLLFLLHNLSFKNMVMGMAVFLISFLLPIVLFCTLLSTQMAVTQAIKGTGGTWSSLNNLEVSKIKYYRLVMGLESPFSNFLNMLQNFLGVSLTIASLLIVDFIKKSHYKILLFLSLPLLIFCGILVKNPNVPFILSERSFPLWALVTSCIFLWACMTNRFQKGNYAQPILLTVWSIFGLILFAKIFLNARIGHYGFVLAMPATLLLIGFFVGLISNWLRESFNRGYIYRYLIMFFIALDIIYLSLFSGFFYIKKNYAVGQSRNYIFSYDPEYDVRGKAVNMILSNMSDMPDMHNLLVIPEGVMINFLTKRPSSIEFYSFMLPEILIYGENHILVSMKNNPPQYILLLDRDTSEYGVKYFGKNEIYGKKIIEWLNGNYSIIWQKTIEYDSHFDLRSSKLDKEITVTMFKKYEIIKPVTKR